MAISKGFIKCPERHCSEIAEVLQASGKRSTLYTKCPACGTNQGNGVARQKHLSENLKVSREDLEDTITSNDFHMMEKVREKAAIPSKNEASSVSGDTDEMPVDDAERIPKGSPTAPPVLLGVLALGAALITAIFATRKPTKPTNKPKGQTA